MPDFDDIARVRTAELERSWKDILSNPDKSKDTWKEIFDQWAEGGKFNGSFGAKSSSAAKGIVWKTWDKQKFAIRIPNFAAHCKVITPDIMTLDDFAKMKKAGFASDKNLTVHDGLSEQLGDTKDAKRIQEWLQEKYGYEKKEEGVAADLATQYLELEEGMRDIQTLATFATLDRPSGSFFPKKDGVLKYIEAHEGLSDTKSSVATRIEWEDVARVENTDLAALGFPSDFTNDILATMTAKSEEEDKGKIKKGDWDAYKLSEVLTDFIKRDKIKEDETAKETYSGNLKFFQIADVLPGKCKLGEDFAVKFGKQPNENGAVLEATVVPPTLDQLAARTGLLSARPEEVKRWLDEKGYKDGWRSGIKYSTNMANQVVKWGSGMIAIPGVKRPGPKENQLPGPDAAKNQRGVKDQYTDVACRLAAFVKFDENRKHGKLTFDKALPILYTGLALQALRSTL